jgi:hypothetical protein
MAFLAGYLGWGAAATQSTASTLKYSAKENKNEFNFENDMDVLSTASKIDNLKNKTLWLNKEGVLYLAVFNKKDIDKTLLESFKDKNIIIFDENEAEAGEKATKEGYLIEPKNVIRYLEGLVKKVKEIKETKVFIDPKTKEKIPMNFFGRHPELTHNAFTALKGFSEKLTREQMENLKAAKRDGKDGVLGANLSNYAKNYNELAEEISESAKEYPDYKTYLRELPNNEGFVELRTDGKKAQARALAEAAAAKGDGFEYVQSSEAAGAAGVAGSASARGRRGVMRKPVALDDFQASLLNAMMGRQDR